jgi:hypothetical protein
MTKKRKRWPTLEEKKERPWCFYCERDFDDMKILISHQKAKHFKCDRCGRRLNTAGGLNVHMTQVHKENLEKVENAIPGRQNLDLEIFGVEGIPAEVKQQHEDEITRQHFEEAKARAHKSGNPLRDGYTTGGNTVSNKRQKTREDLNDILTRVVKFRTDKANGVLPIAPPVEIIPKASPPVAHSYGAPPAQASPFPPGGQFPPPGQPFVPNAAFPQPGFGGPPGFVPGGSPIGGMPPRPGSITGPTGLPQRPPFGAPPPGLPQSDISASVDDLIASAAAAAAPAEAAAPATEKKSKKDKNIKLVYFDDNISPEEKMAALQRYSASVRK